MQDVFGGAAWYADYPLEVFVTENAHAARWVAAALGAFAARRPEQITPNQWHAAITWLALAGVVPAVGKKDVPNVHVAGIACAVNHEDGDFSSVVYRSAATADEHPVVPWLMPLLVHGAVRFVTPVAVAHAAHCIRRARYMPALATFVAWRNLPLLFANAVAVPGATVLARGVLASGTAGDRAAAARAATDTSAVPLVEGTQLVSTHRLHRGMTFADVLDELHRVDGEIAPFAQADADGIAAALAALLAELGLKRRVAAPVIAPAAAPPAKRRRAPRDADSDTDEDA